MDYTCDSQQPSGEKMQQGTLLTVVGGRVVTSSYSSNGKYPNNGQQLMMQLDSLTSSMMDMAVTTDEVEMEVKRAHLLQYILTYFLFRK